MEEHIFMEGETNSFQIFADSITHPAIPVLYTKAVTGS